MQLVLLVNAFIIVYKETILLNPNRKTTLVSDHKTHFPHNDFDSLYTLIKRLMKEFLHFMRPLPPHYG